jgi:type VI secretion system secreted protein Hcp
MITGLFAGAATAQEIYARITDIPGTSTDNGRTDWIKLTSMSEGLAVAVPAGSTGAARGGGKASFQDISITKAIDAASIKLRESALSGKRLAQVEIEVVRGGQQPTVAYKITLKNVALTSVSGSFGSGDIGQEAVAMSYEEISWSFTPTASGGRAGTEVKSGWNITKNSKP